MPPHFLSWQARSHFHVAYYFAHNCYTASLSLHTTAIQPPSPDQGGLTFTSVTNKQTKKLNVFCNNYRTVQLECIVQLCSDNTLSSSIYLVMTAAATVGTWLVNWCQSKTNVDHLWSVVWSCILYTAGITNSIKPPNNECIESSVLHSGPLNHTHIDTLSKPTCAYCWWSRVSSNCSVSRCVSKSWTCFCKLSMRTLRSTAHKDGRMNLDTHTQCNGHVRQLPLEFLPPGVQQYLYGISAAGFFTGWMPQTISKLWMELTALTPAHWSSCLLDQQLILGEAMLLLLTMYTCHYFVSL